jgi:hypothetical protein
VSTAGKNLSDNARTAELGDLDGDGDLDAFVARSGADQVWFSQNAADLIIFKSAEPPVAGPGQTVTYTPVYTNNGPESPPASSSPWSP